MTLPAAAEAVASSRGAVLVRDERHRQITVEGYTPELDRRYTHGELTAAAWCYLTETMEHDHDQACVAQPPPEWPWGVEEWKPDPDPVRNLIKAAALLCAEIDRRVAAGPVDVASPPTTDLISGGGATKAGDRS